MTGNLNHSAVRILVADDHPLFRAGVVAELRRNPAFTIIAEAGDGQQALDLIQRLQPDVAILDVMMPQLTGLEVARRLNQTECPTAVILLTMLNEQTIFLQALEFGVRGYVLKDAAVQDIEKAVSQVADGKYYLSPDLSGLLIKKTTRINTPDAPSALQSLSPAERTVMRLVAELQSNQEIADRLFISVHTVENHKVNIARKLDLKGRNALLKFAVEHKARL